MDSLRNPHGCLTTQSTSSLVSNAVSPALANCVSPTKSGGTQVIFFRVCWWRPVIHISVRHVDHLYFTYMSPWQHNSEIKRQEFRYSDVYNVTTRPIYVLYRCVHGWIYTRKERRTTEFLQKTPCGTFFDVRWRLPCHYLTRQSGTEVVTLAYQSGYGREYEDGLSPSRNCGSSLSHGGRPSS